MRVPIPLLCVVSAAAVIACPAAGAAESDDTCTPVATTGPVTLSSPGIYCLIEDRPDPEGHGITITAPDVTLDCRGFALGHSANPYNMGVWSYENATDVVVRDCDIRGYSFGILLYGGGIIEDNTLRDVHVRGIYVEGDGSIIRRNRVYDTGASSSHTTYAISGFGDVDIVDNLVDGVVVPEVDGERIIGILGNDGLTPGQTFVIRGNVVRNLRPAAGQEAIAIYSGSTGGLVIRDNVLFGPDTAPAYGIQVPFGALTHITENDLYDFPDPLYGGDSETGNVIRP